MSVINNFDINNNFWETNTQFKVIEPFKSLYTSDKSKKKEKSSKIMWAIAFLVDNSEDNKFRNLLDEEKRIIIADDYLDDSSFNWDDYEELIEKYETLNMSKYEKSLRIYESKLEERNKFIKDTAYDMETATQLDKIISSTKSIFDLISKLRDDINKEKSSGETKGSMVESANELGLI